MDSPDRSSPQSLADSAVGSSTSPDLHRSDHSNGQEENFECFGENIDVAYDDDVVDDSTAPLAERNFVGFNTWARTSLRRTSSNHDNMLPVSPQRWGSFRGQRQRSSAVMLSGPLTDSFNNSGWSSNCDDGDMQSDTSLEDDIIDLNNKVQQLQEQVGVLAESQTATDSKYMRVKQDNAAMTARIHLLEEQIRELEVRGEERLEEEKRRNRDMVHRLEREKQLEIENHTMKMKNVETEYKCVMEEFTLLRNQIEQIKGEKMEEEEKLIEMQHLVARRKKEHEVLQEIYRKEQGEWSEEKHKTERVIEELTRDLQKLQRQSGEEQRKKVSVEEDNDEDDVLSDMITRISYMEGEVRILREQNKRLNENNEELQAQMLNRGLDEGIRMIQETENSSLAAEFEAMSENEMKKALQDQQEINARLKCYIDNVLLNIMEKYPELLEVRTKR